MNIKFKKDEIELVEGSNVSIITLKQLKEDVDNNYLFKLLESCVRSESLSFDLDDNASPYISKLYNILSEEFQLDDDDL